MADNRYDREREDMERGRGFDARTGDQVGGGDSRRTGQFEPGARGGIDDRFGHVPRTRQEAIDAEERRSREGRDRGRGGEPGAYLRDRDEARYQQRGRGSASGLDVFDRSLQITHVWLNEIIDEIGMDKRVAWHALSAVLRAVRDRIRPELAVHLGAQLPLLIRGAYYDQFRLVEPERTRSLDDFLDSVADHMRGIGRPVDPHDAFHAVVRTLTRHISEGQIDKVVDSLPRPVARSWDDACYDVRGPEERAADEGRGYRAHYPTDLVARDR